MSVVGTFRKKPVDVRAIRFDGDNAGDCLIFCDDADAWIGRTNIYDGTGGVEQVAVIVISTLEGNTVAKPGDWIIRGTAGEFYPCRADIFEAIYDRVES